MVFEPFLSEDGCRLCHFGLESGLVFEETAGVDERIYRLIPIEYGREICEFEVNFKKSFHDTTSFLALTLIVSK